MTSGSAFIAAQGSRSLSCQRRRMRRGVSSWSSWVNSWFSKNELRDCGELPALVRGALLLGWRVGVLVGVGWRRQRRCGIGGDEGFGNFEEDEFAGFRLWAGAAAEIDGGDAAFDNAVDGVVGVELGAWAAVGVHVGEDADYGCAAVVHEDDSAFVGCHGNAADLVDAEGYA